MSATKLLVLGVARIFQPVHGYVVRRELLSWKVDQWANVKPGSIYGALRTLVKEGSLDEVGTESEGGRPARTTYRVNEDGEVEFFDLFRRNLWQNVDSTDLSGFRAALSFIWVARRDEVLQAMEHRINLLDGCLKEQRFGREQMAGIAENRITWSSCTASRRPSCADSSSGPGRSPSGSAPAPTPSRTSPAPAACGTRRSW